MSKKGVKFLFFIGGIIAASVVVGTVIKRNYTVHHETDFERENQTSEQLNISKTILPPLRSAAEKAKELANETDIVKKLNKFKRNAKTPSFDSYEASWQLVKAQNEAYVKSRLS
jgi:hypothetical protein